MTTGEMKKTFKSSFAHWSVSPCRNAIMAGDRETAADFLPGPVQPMTQISRQKKIGNVFICVLEAVSIHLGHLNAA